MTTRLVTRPADEERFRDFKARRLAKKEADREKLATQFPLLFNNKSVGNKVTNTNLALNKSATIITPGKRKSTFIDKNDENCALSANKPIKNNIGSKTPLSSKKQRKGSLILSPKAQVRGPTGLSKTLPSIPTYTRTAPEPTSVVSSDITPMEVSVATEAVPQSVTKACTAAAVGDIPQGVELTTVTRKALFEDSELEKCTSTRSSLSSLGDSIMPEVENTAVEEDAVKECDAPAASGEEVAEVQEQVLDVLDYLLELDEVDEQTYRRMSSQSFSAKAIKRLSMTMQPWTLPAVGRASSTSYVGEEEESATSSAGNSTQRSSAGVSMEVAYPGIAEGEDCVIGELDVLNALRNYLATMDKEVAVDAEQEKEDVSTDAAPTATEVTVEEKEQPCSNASARSSTSSAGTFTDKPEWRDSLVPSGRQSCTTTMRVSFLNSSTAVTSDAAEEQDAHATTSPVPAVAEQTAPKPSGKAVVTYPLRELLDDALQRGLVVPVVTSRIEMGNHTKYIVETQILSVPGYPAENSKVRMMCMKRYSDFKTLRAALIEAVETQRRIDARSSTENSSLRSSLEGSATDILSIARSRRSSVESDRDSLLLLNARDSLCADGAAFPSSGRPSEAVPPLPSRQVMSMSCASLQAEQDFQQSREAFLAGWVEAVFARQSCECAEFRLELRKFLTA